MNRTLHAPLSRLLLYGLGTVAGHAVNLLLLPVISRRLAPDAYGIFSMAFVLFTLFGMVLDLGVLQGLIKLYSEAATGTNRKRIFTTSALTITLTSTTLCLPVALFAPSVANLIFGSSAYAPHVLAVTAGAWASVFFQLILAFHRSALSPVKHGVIALVRALMFGAFTLVLLTRLDNGLVALFTGWLLPYLLIAACLLPFLMYRNAGRFSMGIARSLIKYGLPIVPSYLILWLLTHTDLYLLRRLASMEHVGYYTLAAQICFLLAPVNTALQMGWLPFVLRTAARSPQQAPGQIGRLWTIVFATTGMFSLTLAAFAPELIKLIAAPAYAPAAAAVPLLCLSTLLYTCFLIFSSGIHVDGGTWRLLLITATGAVVNIILNLFAIPRWGITGAAAATVVSNTIMAATAACIAHRRFPVPYINRLSITAAAVLITAAAVCMFIPAQTVAGIAAKAAVIGTSAALLVKTGVIGRNLFAHAAATARKMMP